MQIMRANVFQESQEKRPKIKEDIIIILFPIIHFINIHYLFPCPSNAILAD